ncbi:MAG: hypothetical protein LBC49_05310 [Bacteroidales bacterium]|jgi:hypothetical protein|nr:hypothetical protein [Bacteroidales bacterium]
MKKNILFVIALTTMISAVPVKGENTVANKSASNKNGSSGTILPLKVTAGNPYTENFESTDVNSLPPGWVNSAVTSTGLEKVWSVKNENENKLLRHVGQVIDTPRKATRVYTPCLDLSTVAAKLTFDHFEKARGRHIDTLNV